MNTAQIPQVPPEPEPDEPAAIPAGFLRDPAHLLALGFGTGCAPVAPGTAGTLAGAVIWAPMHLLAPMEYAAGVCVMFAAGVWICGRAAAALDTEDHPAIVWDEITGFLITMTGAPPGLAWLLAGFILFRLFDILKPWPIGLLDRRVPGGLGIMLDDAAAGFSGLICLQLIAYLLIS